MKECRRCKNSKPLSEFNKNKSQKDGLDPYCRECANKQNRKFYNNNKERLYSHYKEYYVKEKQDYISSLKQGKKCEKCGYNKCLSALEFHHIDPSQKEFGIGNSYRKGEEYKEKMREEIDKCIILCSNCHREFHSEEKQNGITIEQFLK